MLGAAAATVGAFFMGATPALADGAVSATTVARARGIYGARIQALAAAVEKGDLEAIAAEKNSFTLFVSGVYTLPGKANKEVERFVCNSSVFVLLR